MYANIKVMDVSGFDIVAYSDWVIDKTKPYMIVRHIKGKKQAPHFHVVGVPTDVDYLKPDPRHPDSGKGKKPIQQKKENGVNKLYDEHAFEYLVKPSEWTPDEKCVIETSFTSDEVAAMAEASRIYWDNKKGDLDHLLSSIEPIPDEEPEQYHMRLSDAVWTKIIQDDTEAHPTFKWKILKTIAKRGGRYRPYACRKAFM